MPNRSRECPPWCAFIDGKCRPTPIEINAVRLRTRDGRYLIARDTSAGVYWPRLVAANVNPQASATFRFALSTTWPLDSNGRVVLSVCDNNWGSSGNLIRVEESTVHIPEREMARRYGGDNTNVWIASASEDLGGRLSIEGSYTFFMEKVGGGQINTGDEVSLSTEHSFYFRAVDQQDGSAIICDGTVAGPKGTIFIVEFNEVRLGLGWRPPTVICETCGTVGGVVTNVATGLSIVNARVETVAQGTPFKANTDANGHFALSADDGENCIPAGNQTLVASHYTHQTRSISITVPAGGHVDASIQLECTDLRGRVIYDDGRAIIGVGVYLIDRQTESPVVDSEGHLYFGITDRDGKFIIKCVPQGDWNLWVDTNGATSISITIPPQGLEVEIRIPTGTGYANIVGIVTDADTNEPISGASVKVIPSSQGIWESTTGRDGRFKIENAPPGRRVLRASADNYATSNNNQVNVPYRGDSSPVHIKLHRIAIPAVSEINIVVTWGEQPPDLDSHLSGPDGRGGRFHLSYQNRTSPPVDFASLDTDDTTGKGPETIIIRKSPSTQAYVGGEYHYWIHNYSHMAHRESASTFSGSDAEVIVLAPPQGVIPIPTIFGRFKPSDASGDPSNDIWHVVNLKIDSDGTVTAETIQTFKQGDYNTIF